LGKVVTISAQMGKKRVDTAIADAKARLSAVSDSASLDAQVLLAHVLGKERGWLLAHPEAELSAGEESAWQAALARLEAGEPLPYVLGEWEFFGLTLKVTPDVLIPRPETELLVETALEWLAKNPGRRAADVGTGSGEIAVALAANVADLQIWAGDLSPAALAVARANVEQHGLQERVRLVESDLLTEMAGPFDLICANLPYIPSERLGTLRVARSEPVLALDGGTDGLALIAKLLEQAASKLAPGGLLLAEVDDSHGESAPSMAREFFGEAQIELLADLAGKPRLLKVQL
jgi:release factor glutamine methyltransferase